MFQKRKQFIERIEAQGNQGNLRFQMDVNGNTREVEGPVMMIDGVLHEKSDRAPIEPQFAILQWYLVKAGVQVDDERLAKAMKAWQAKKEQDGQAQAEKLKQGQQNNPKAGEGDGASPMEDAEIRD